MTHRWYLFLDEGGDLNFKGNGSRFFTVSSLATRRPFELANVLADLRFDVIEEGLDIEYFHASEDRQAVRDRVFEAVVSHLDSVRLHSVVEEKSTVPLASGMRLTSIPRKWAGCSETSFASCCSRVRRRSS